MMEWKVLQSTYLHKEPWFTVRKEICELPNGKVHSSYFVLEYPSWVTVFPITRDGKVLMVKQYRHGLGVISIELPGGVVDVGETPLQAARREVMEETGYAFDNFEFMGKVSANPATSNNWMHMYLARDGQKVSEQNLDETEDVEVMEKTIEELKSYLRKNEIVQALHVTCMLYGLDKLGELRY